MASGSTQPLASTSTPVRVQNANPLNFASPIEPNGGASSSKAASATPAPAPVPTPTQVKQPVYKGRTPRSYVPGVPLSQRDLELASGAFNRAVAALVADQRAAVEPDTETPFADAHDAVKRLLPYHIFQLPVEDGKGKGRASEADLAREELAETRFALQCHKRKRALEERFRKARMKPGKRKSPDVMTYWLEAKGLEDDKTDMQALNHELRAARAELDRTERAERDKRASSTARAASAAPTPSSAAPATPSTPSTAYAHPYQAYRYPYGQMSPSYNTNATPYYATPASASASTAAHVPSTPATPTPASAAPTITKTAASPPATPSTSSSTNAMSMPRGPVPLQLPATSLPRLNQLGIYPAPRSTSSATPAPSAILVGTIENGRLLNLEINLAALQPTQMTGLAEMLTALTEATRAQGQTEGAGQAPSYAQMGAPYALPGKKDNEKEKEES
ncbi:hypothetical protein PENSPDRAFT_651285 [Peniophora sp. CONT]|nr:hypothetical protein PENSPDRAFT_651285 [Peniophora sp. CONT]